MKTTITNVVPNHNLNNNISSRLFLMDCIIEEFSCLFNNENEEKNKQLKSLEDDYQKLKSKSKELLSTINNIDEQLSRENYRRKFYLLIDNFIKYDVMYGPYKKSILDLFNNFDNYSISEITKKIQNLARVLKDNIK